MKKSLALLPVALLALSLAACGGKNDAASGDQPKISAGATVPAPAGKAWSDVVAASPDGGYVMGNPKASIRIAEYGSFTCPHCAEFTKESSEEIAKMVDTGKMSFEFRPFVRDPLDLSVALLAACGGPDAFVPLYHQLFANQEEMFAKAQAAGNDAYGKAAALPPQQRFIALAQLGGLIDFAKQRGISEEKAKQCLADDKAGTALVAHVQKANETYDIQGTPTFLMNGRVIENVATWSDLKAKLKETGL